MEAKSGELKGSSRRLRHLEHDVLTEWESTAGRQDQLVDQEFTLRQTGPSRRWMFNGPHYPLSYSRQLRFVPPLRGGSSGSGQVFGKCFPNIDLLEFDGSGVCRSAWLPKRPQQATHAEMVYA